MTQRAYTGLKVIDLSQGVAGPCCGMLLAQHGADVIKVEPVETGDWSRDLGVKYGDQTAYSIPMNLGKRGVALDLKQPAGHDLLWRLIGGADILIQNFRPGVIDRLGFGYEPVAARESRILYVSISGFGAHGHLAERPAMDPVLQAFTGLTAENAGEDRIPHRIPVVAIDMSTALFAFGALGAALFVRERTGTGQHIQASLLEAAAGLQVIRMLQQYLEDGKLRPPAAPNGVYATADGWISVTVVRPFEWEAFCRTLDLGWMLQDARFATIDDRITHADAMRAELRPMFAGQPFAHWSARLAAAKVMHERLNTYAEFLVHPQTAECGAFTWVEHPSVPRPMPLPNLIGAPCLAAGSPFARAPSHGEHTDSVLLEHGVGHAELAELRARKIVR